MHRTNDGMEGVGINPFSPPSADEYKRQWVEAYRNRPIEYERKADKNRRQAIKEILQEQVKLTVAPDERLNKIFMEQIDKSR